MRAIYYLMSGFLFMVLSAISLGNWVPHKNFFLSAVKGRKCKKNAETLKSYFLTQVIEIIRVS